MVTFIDLLILLMVYVLGCSLSFIVFAVAMYRETGKLEKPVLMECIMCSMFSWISFMVSLFFITELAIQRKESNEKNKADNNNNA